MNNGDLDDRATDPSPDSDPAHPGLNRSQGDPTGSTSDEVEQSELDLGVISTGTTVVDHALSPLEGLGNLPVADHPQVFERVLSDLSATMAEGVADEGSPRDA
ncbi:MAG: hypothetical protein ACJ73L_11415 [Actinomycetes bacterium]